MSASARACTLALLAATALSACNPAPAPLATPTPTPAATATASVNLGDDLRQFDRDVIERLRRLPERQFVVEEREAVAKGTTLNAPAPAAAVDALAARIGKPLPPSFREFLATSNGMLYVAPLNTLALLPADAVVPLTDANYPGLAIWRAMPDAAIPLDATAGGPLPGSAFAHAWVISTIQDGDVYLIFPGLARADGEWPVWFFGPKNPGAIGYRSFGDMLARERAAALAELERRQR